MVAASSLANCTIDYFVSGRRMDPIYYAGQHIMLFKNNFYMDKITFEATRNLETLEKNAALLRHAISKGTLTPSDWLEAGECIGTIRRAITNSAALIGLMVQKAASEIKNQNKQNGTN